MGGAHLGFNGDKRETKGNFVMEMEKNRENNEEYGNGDKNYKN